MTTTPTRAVKSTEEYFNSSRLKVIGLITAATVAVGALGGIGGVVFDHDPISEQPSIQPGSGAGSLGGVGNSARLGPRDLKGFTAFAAGVRADDTGGPSSVGSVSPGTGGFSSSPGPTTDPTPAQGGGQSGGSGVTMTGTDVDVFVPDGWEVTFQDEQNVAQTNGNGSYSFAYSTVVDPSTAAGDIIADNIDTFLPPENYTQRQTSDIVPLEPFGSVVSVAALGYEALWVDNQGSESIHGEMYVGVRQDGTALVILIEHLPAEDYDAAVDEMGPIVDLSFTRFAGLG